MHTFEDFIVGETIEHGTRTVSAEDIVAFARLYDPQPFHLDLAAPEAKETGGPIASGWHVAAIFMRLMTDSMLLDSTSMGSPGIETLKWVKPVRPGDKLSARSTVIGTRASQSRPAIGLVRFRHEAFRADGETVMTMDNTIMFGRRTEVVS